MKSGDFVGGFEVQSPFSTSLTEFESRTGVRIPGSDGAELLASCLPIRFGNRTVGMTAGLSRRDTRVVRALWG